MEFLESFVAFTNDILWSYVLIVMLVGLGIWFSLRTRFVQVRCLKEMVRLLKEGVGQKTEITIFLPSRHFVSALLPVLVLVILPALRSLSSAVVPERFSGCGSSPF